MVLSLDVRFSQYDLVFHSEKPGETLMRTLTITNLTSSETLEGRWEVIPHENDPHFPPHSHPWIEIKPRQFTSNQVRCLITVDTRQLQAGKTGERELLLHTNSTLSPTHLISLKVTTAPLSLEQRKIPYLPLLGLLIAGFCWASISLSIYHQNEPQQSLMGAFISVIVTLFCGVRLLFFPGHKKFKLSLQWAIVGMTGSMVISGILGAIVGATDGGFIGGIIGGYVATLMMVSLVTIAQLDQKSFQLISHQIRRNFYRSILGIIWGIMLYFFSTMIGATTLNNPLLFILWGVGITHLIFWIKSIINTLKSREFEPRIAVVLPWLVTVVGIILGISGKTDSSNLVIQFPLFISLLSLGGLLFYSQWSYRQYVLLTQQEQEKLIPL